MSISSKTVLSSFFALSSPIFCPCVSLMTLSVAAEETLLPTRGAIHPKIREQPAPCDGHGVTVNPPSLMWPAEPGKQVSYSVRLSQDQRFPKQQTIAAENIPWAMFNPHTKLAPGTWYWQYAITENDKAKRWSEVLEFNVTSSARLFVTPPASEMIASCPRSHPRLLITAEELPAFRSRIEQSREAQTIVANAQRSLGRQLPPETAGIPEDKGKNAKQRKKFATWASKKLAGRMNSSVRALASAYLLTGNEKFGCEAIRHAVHVAKWDPNGVTSSRVSNFADGSCLRAVSTAYDSCHSLLSKEEKALLLESILFRANRFYNKWCNRLETKVFSAHIWQHILNEFTEAAFATLGEIPVADQWAEYIYELWLARVPLQGGNDGGWANGNNYFATNFATLISIPAFFESLTGVNFFNHPWYQNTVYYMLYTWPPGSRCDGFGDGCEKRNLPPTGRIGFADALSRELDDPVASWYVDRCLKSIDKDIEDDGVFRWYRLRHGSSKKPPAAPEALDLPQALAFRDIGLVTMHTDLKNTPRNLMLAFRSSPYGSFNHAHADQNSFNVLFGGKELFSNSGYYIAYGDEHFQQWYKHSRGHNTVLIDGTGQSFGPDGYGWIPRYLHGKRISYCLGDASAAYRETGLKRFRRHVALLRPSIVVIYDDLEAKRGAEWNWLLHSPGRISASREQQRLFATTETARSRVDLLSSIPLKIGVDTQFDPPAWNWRKRKNKDGTLHEYADQWHVSAISSKQTEKIRYLAIIQILPADNKAEFKTPTRVKDGRIELGQWQIRAELDTSENATLEIRNIDGATALAVNTPRLTLNGRDYRASGPKSSMLIEHSEDKHKVQHASDEFPPAAAVE